MIQDSILDDIEYHFFGNIQAIITILDPAGNKNNLCLVDRLIPETVLQDMQSAFAHVPGILQRIAYEAEEPMIRNERVQPWRVKIL